MTHLVSCLAPHDSPHVRHLLDVADCLPIPSIPFPGCGIGLLIPSTPAGSSGCLLTDY